MADSAVPITQGSGTNIDTRTESTNGNHRQVVVFGDPALNNNVAAVATQDVGATDQTTPAVLMRLAGSASVQLVGQATTLAVSLDPGHELGSIKSINSTVSVAFSPAKPIILADMQGTASIFTVSGSTSGVSVSGVTLIAPSASYNFKIFAYSIQTTGVVSMTPRFTNGAGSTPTDFWRPLITAASSTSAPIGANLAVNPPGYLFATGVNTTLALLNDGSLVHYSVSYIKESA